MLNYTYDTVQLVDDQPSKTVYLGHSRDIAETKAVLMTTAGNYQFDHAVIRVETGERVSMVRASTLKAIAGAAGLL